jgi:hypothetical protein
VGALQLATLRMQAKVTKIIIPEVFGKMAYAMYIEYKRSF